MNSRNVVLGVVLVVVVILGGLWVYDWVLGDTEAASGPISAPTVVMSTATEIVVMPTEVPPTEIVEPTQEPIAANPEPTQETTAAEDTQSGGMVVYQITQEESEVSFTIFEELNGAPKDVIGTSDQVAGEVALDFGNLDTTQVGEILINARTLVTDDDRRNSAIRNRILNTDQYEFISFTPTELRGLSGVGEVGQSYNFQIAGDLTIRDVTRPVVFDVNAMVEGENRIVGTASTSISRADYNLNIPNVPFVANVADNVDLEIDFVLVSNLD